MQQLPLTIKHVCIIAITVLVSLVVSGCAASDGAYGSGSARSAGGSKVLACKSGDTQISSSTQCLQDSAACYELANGQWCTGERGNTCPAGSDQIPAGQPCPNGTRCIQFGESLNCAIQVR